MICSIPIIRLVLSATIIRIVHFVHLKDRAKLAEVVLGGVNRIGVVGP
jgi:hypothetical protein